MNSEDTPRHYTINEASRALGIHPKTFERMRKKYGIKPTDERRSGRVRVLLFSEAVIDYLRSERHESTIETSRVDTTEQPSNVLTLAPRPGEALAIRLYEDNQSLMREVTELRMENAALLAEVAALTARQHTPRRRWWQRRQREDGQ